MIPYELLIVVQKRVYILTISGLDCGSWPSKNRVKGVDFRDAFLKAVPGPRSIFQIVFYRSVVVLQMCFLIQLSN